MSSIYMMENSLFINKVYLFEKTVFKTDGKELNHSILIFDLSDNDVCKGSSENIFKIIGLDKTDALYPITGAFRVRSKYQFFKMINQLLDYKYIKRLSVKVGTKFNDLEAYNLLEITRNITRQRIPNTAQQNSPCYDGNIIN